MGRYAIFYIFSIFQLIRYLWHLDSLWSQNKQLIYIFSVFCRNYSIVRCLEKKEYTGEKSVSWHLIHTPKKCTKYSNRRSEKFTQLWDAININFNFKPTFFNFKFFKAFSSVCRIVKSKSKWLKSNEIQESWILTHKQNSLQTHSTISIIKMHPNPNVLTS